MDQDADKSLFYFSRTAPPAEDSKYLVSGVIEAETLDDAVAQLGAALRKAALSDSPQYFRFQDLGCARGNEHGLLAITTAEEEI